MSFDDSSLDHRNLPAGHGLGFPAMRRLALLAAVLPLIAAAPAAAATHGDLVSSKPLSGGNVLKNASKNLLVTYKTQGVAGSLVDVTGSVAIPKGKAPNTKRLGIEVSQG